MAGLRPAGAPSEKQLLYAISLAQKANLGLSADILTDKRACSTFIDSQACSQPPASSSALLHSRFPLPPPLRTCAPLCTLQANSFTGRSLAATDRRRPPTERRRPPRHRPRPRCQTDSGKATRHRQRRRRQRGRSARRRFLSERQLSDIAPATPAHSGVAVAAAT